MSARVVSAKFGARIAAAVTAILLFGAASLAGITPASEWLSSPPAHAEDLDNFDIDSFSGEYRLSVDEEGRSSLQTTEHIIAVFPDYDQNRGLIRDLVRVYDGHETGLKVLSVTDENGLPRDFDLEEYGDFLSVIIAVPEGSYVYGEQHYVIEYTQRDVTRHFEDTGVDEFYWDINGTGWQQPFGTVTARVVLSEQLIAAFDGSVACYFGEMYDSTPCEFTTDETSITAQVHGLDRGENLSIALGFAPGTFTPAPTPPKPPVHFLERVPILLWAGGASLVAAVTAFVVTLVRGRRSRTGRAIVAQYEPPAGMSVALAAQLLRVGNKSLTATLLDLAVRRKIRLLHDATSGLYGAQALDIDGLLPLERSTYSRIFTGSAGPTPIDPGTSFWFSRTSTRLGDAANLLARAAQTEAKKSGLLKRGNTMPAISVALLLVIALALPVLHSVIIGNFTMMTILLALGVNLLVWLLLGSVSFLVTRNNPTPTGALALDHLNGLREYIRLAEADRIRMLQSASGAEVDENFIVQVYERLLPYAVLFGFEKEWQGELAKFYRESTPDWVAGTASTTGSFSQIMPVSSFAQSISSSPVTRTASSSGGFGSGSSFSSSSGGSSGGGFSGGGGGGGGGRGI